MRIQKPLHIVHQPTDSVVIDNQYNIGADVYLDMPLKTRKPTALNFYTSLTYHNFGPKYLRNIGIINQYPTTEQLRKTPIPVERGGAICNLLSGLV